MGTWSVMVLVEMTYIVQADSQEEAEEKAQSGEFTEEDYGGINQIMSSEVISSGSDDNKGGD